MLSDAVGKTDAWFKAHLVEEDGEEGAPPAALEGRAIDVAAERWKRKMVSIGQNSEKLKVYFDNANHQTGIQRGWVICSCLARSLGSALRCIAGICAGISLPPRSCTWSVALGSMRLLQLSRLFL